MHTGNPSLRVTLSFDEAEAWRDFEDNGGVVRQLCLQPGCKTSVPGRAKLCRKHRKRVCLRCVKPFSTVKGPAYRFCSDCRKAMTRDDVDT